MNHRPYNFKDRELSNAEKATIIGFNRQGASFLEIMGIMELKQVTIEEVIQNYFGGKLIKSKLND